MKTLCSFRYDTKIPALSNYTLRSLTREEDVYD